MNTVERLFHSVLFEGLAVLISITGILIFTNIEVFSASKTMIALSLIAMIWNYIFNIIFDRIRPGKRELRSWGTRIIFVLTFELGLLFFTVPVVAYILSINLWQAFILDIGLTIFVTFYALLFNYVYDHTRARIVKNRATNMLEKQTNC